VVHTPVPIGRQAIWTEQAYVPENDGLEPQRLAGLQCRAVRRHHEALGAPVARVETRTGRQLAAEGQFDLAGGLLEDTRQDVLLPVGDGAELATGADRAVEAHHDAGGERDHRSQRLERSLGLLAAIRSRRGGAHRRHRGAQARRREPQLAHPRGGSSSQ
jgi:hypothetical protein